MVREEKREKECSGGNWKGEGKGVGKGGGNGQNVKE